MKGNFPSCLLVVLGWEGGFSDNPADPGGATYAGVTQGTYDSFRRHLDKPLQSVRLIGRAELVAIYEGEFWEAIQGDALPPGVDLMAFDEAVTSGPSEAARRLQQQLGVATDGIIGPETLAAAQRADWKLLVAGLAGSRLGWLKLLPTWSIFGNGWGRRVKGVEQAALGMVGDGHAVSGD